MKNTLVIYHAHCMDGAAAALAAWLRFGDEAEYRPASYGDPAPTDDEVRGRDVYVLDFSYPRAELMRMAAVQYEYTKESPARYWGHTYLIDHHKTAEEDLKDIATPAGANPLDVAAGWPIVRFDMGKSGAALAWEHFHKTAPVFEKTYPTRDLPELFAYIQDRDLWRWELPHSHEVSAALGASGALTDFRKLIPIYEDWDWDSFRDADSTYVDGKRQLIDDGAAILRAERLQIERIAATAEEVEIRYDFKASHVSLNADGSMGLGGSVRTIRALAATSAVLQSEVGEALALESARRGRDAVGVVYYRDGAAGKWRVSLRSRDRRGALTENPRDFEAPDVSAIAKSFGGGGHARAAGFECDELPWSESEKPCPYC